MSTKPDTDLQAIYSDHREVNDVMMAMTIIRQLKCQVCGKTARTTERQGMAAAREMRDLGWVGQLNIDIGKPCTATCPDCALL